MGAAGALGFLRTLRGVYPRRARFRALGFSRGRGLAVVSWHRISPWARGSARSALSALVGAALTPVLLFVLALPFGGAELARRAATTLLPDHDGGLALLGRAGDRVLDRAATAIAGLVPQASPPPTTSPLPGDRRARPGTAAALPVAPKPVATPALTAARPMAPTRFISQAEVRLGVPLGGVGLGRWGHRTQDSLAQVQLELRSDGGCLLQLTTDVTRLVEAPRAGAGYKLIDAFVAHFMPPEAGATAETRLAWFSTALAAQRAVVEREGQVDAASAWNPTFNVGPRVAQAVLEGREFSLLLNVPPEDPGL